MVKISALAALLAILTPGLSAAQTHVPDLAHATLEELMNIEVTSVSRREQRAEDVAASIYVISREEIVRSGLTSLAEVLRLAPGVQVSRLNANKWSVSVRGFNSLASSKLLVMVDGRSIYNPAYSSVFWDTEDLLLEDVDRIEVIRGPGGAMWGANAVNGVINVITRSSAETRGGLARVAAGSHGTSNAAFRYGGGTGALTYRAFAQASTEGQSIEALDDSWHSVTGGIRADWRRGAHDVMFQAGSTVGEQRPLWIDPTAQPVPGPAFGDGALSSTRVSHALTRWTRTGARGQSLQVQGFFDRNHREEFVGFYRRTTLDADLQYTMPLAHGHTVVAGSGYRWLDEQIQGRGPFSFTPEQIRPDIVNAFVQDSVAVASDRGEITVGGKYEHSSFWGSAFQPNARMMWKLSNQQRVWGAVAQAVRTPSLVDRGFRLELAPVPGPNGMTIVPGAEGNPDQKNERLLNVEAGYRLNVSGRLSFDAAGFAGRYDDLTSQELPEQPTFALVNGVPTLYVLSKYHNNRQATTTGSELSARAQLTRQWDVDGSVSFFHIDTIVASTGEPVVGADGDTAARQWRLHSAWTFAPRRLLDVRVMRTGALSTARVPANTRLDARFEWGLTRQLSIAAAGQNLTDDSHLESALFGDSVASTGVPRTGHLGLVWRF
jgi:iron complex outermembrane receptor protein